MHTMCTPLVYLLPAPAVSLVYHARLGGAMCIPCVYHCAHHVHTMVLTLKR